jgi:hypothetical protein
MVQPSPGPGSEDLLDKDVEVYINSSLIEVIKSNGVYGVQYVTAISTTLNLNLILL